MRPELETRVLPPRFSRGDSVTIVAGPYKVPATFVRHERGLGDHAVVDAGGVLGQVVVPLSRLRHAGVLVLGRPAELPRTCPHCGSAMFVDDNAVRVPRRQPGGQRLRPCVVRVAACSGCEHAVEVRRWAR